MTIAPTLLENYQEVEQLPDIASVGSTNAMIGDFLGSNIYRPRRPDVSDLRANIVTYDDDFMPDMDFNIVQGRGFEEAFNDSTSVIELRTKEICVRKILGASLGSIFFFFLLSRTFLQLVLISLVLSVPLSYFAISKWLERFAYRIQPDWFTFVKAGLIALVLVLLAIGYQSVKISMLNMSEHLRAE